MSSNVVIQDILLLCLFFNPTLALYCNANYLNWISYQGDEQDCPILGEKSLTFYNPILVPWGMEGRAWFTAPPEIKIKNSSIPGVGLGAFATTFISSNTWLAEYEGEVMGTDEEDLISEYAWRIYHNDEITHYIDAGNLDTSNWLRWINCARNHREENVKGVYCKGKVFYITLKDIHPGQELLVYYGYDYAQKLGIDTNAFNYYVDN